VFQISSAGKSREKRYYGSGSTAVPGTELDGGARS